MGNSKATLYGWFSVLLHFCDFLDTFSSLRLPFPVLYPEFWDFLGHILPHTLPHTSHSYAYRKKGCKKMETESLMEVYTILLGPQLSQTERFPFLGDLGTFTFLLLSWSQLLPWDDLGAVTQENPGKKMIFPFFESFPTPQASARGLFIEFFLPCPSVYF